MWGMQVENSTICTTCNCVTSNDCASNCQRRVLKSICSLAPLSLCLSVCLSNCVSFLISTRVAISHTLYSMKWHSSLYIYTLLNRPTENSYFAYNQFPRLDLKLTWAAIWGNIQSPDKWQLLLYTLWSLLFWFCFTQVSACLFCSWDFYYFV